MIGGAKTPVTRPVDLGLPSGTLWAPANLNGDRRGGFDPSPLMLPNFFVSFGNLDGHAPVSPSSFGDWSFGSSSDGEPYVSSPGASIEPPGPYDLEFDIARHVAGGAWRVPSHEEWVELFDNCIFIDADGVEIPDSETNKTCLMPLYGGAGTIMCLRLRSIINGAELILALTKYGTGSTFTGSNFGIYWSSSAHSAAQAYCLNFNTVSVNINRRDGRYLGFAIRPVMSTP